MRARLMKVAAALAALGALAVGGSTLASAGSKQAPPSPPAAVEKAGVEAQQGADTDTLQQGDQSAADTAAEAAGSESESSSESSETGVSDGPGGYADSNANADTQQQGEN